jgi:pilus assembly protein CpaB
MARSVAGSAQGRTNRRFLLIAILLAALSAALVYAKISTGTEDSGGGSTAAGSTQVVVAKSAIKQRTAITSEMLRLETVPTDTVISGAFTSVNDVVGKVTKFPVEANQQVFANAVVDVSTPAGEALAQVVPNGRRGYSFTVSEVRTAGGLILPGDYVDVVWACCKDEIVLSRTVLQNVQVAAVSQELIQAGPTGPDDENPVSAGGDEPKPEAVSITVLVSNEQAHFLLMAELTGEMRATLRGPGDTTIEPPAQDFSLVTELLPPEILATIPEGLWPDGYRDQQ